MSHLAPEALFCCTQIAGGEVQRCVAASALHAQARIGCAQQLHHTQMAVTGGDVQSSAATVLKPVDISSAFKSKLDVTHIPLPSG